LGLGRVRIPSRRAVPGRDPGVARCPAFVYRGHQLAMSYTYEYPRPALTVDCVVFRIDAGGLELLLIQRGLPPFLGQWALPGGFVRIDETTEHAARRELAEEAGMR
jgi:NADH pyrophosphatase NudC (nudix superfamily)